MKKNIIYLLILSLGIFAFSCDPDDPTPEPIQQAPSIDQTINAISEYALVNKIFSDSFSEADKAAKNGDKQLEAQKYGQAGDYPVVTITPLDTTTWPKNIKVDYGTSNYVCNDGVKRRGIINIQTTGFYREADTEITVTYDGFYHNDHKVEGTMKVVNDGRNDNNNLVYNVTIAEGKITTPQDKIIYFNENTSREWAAGENTVFDPCDDNYLIEGSQDGMSSDSIEYTLTVQQKLDILACCKYVRAGVLKISITGILPFTVNFDGSTCDEANIVATINGAEYPITM